MMTFDEFLKTVQDNLQNRFSDMDVQRQEVNKLQNESYVGIAIRPKDSNAAVTFNIQEMFNEYVKNEQRLPNILDKIGNDAEQALSNMPSFDTNIIEKYENVKDHLVMQMVPIKGNEDILKTIPHRIVDDLAVVYRVEMAHMMAGAASALLTNTIMQNFGITEEQLHQDAVRSQVSLHPPVLKNMTEVMKEMMGDLFDDNESPMWVATNDGGIQGASVVEIPEFMEQSAEKLGGDFFVIPSSVHEVLFIRDDGSFSKEHLEEMLRDVNSTNVAPADYLSDSLYHYDSEGQVFEKADTFASRVAEAGELYNAVPEKETITVLLVEPEKHPRPVEIRTELEDLQKAVGGYIEVTYPFDDNAAIVVNEEGKLNGMQLNRALRDEEGEIYDIVAGPFLVVGLTEENFGSLTPEQMKTYEEQFHSPEVFMKMGRSIMSIPIPDEDIKAKEQKEKTPEQPHRKAQEAVL